MGNILKLVEHCDTPSNEYWIGIEPVAADACPPEKRILLGPPCRSIAELDKLISEMQADLRSLTAEGTTWHPVCIPAHPARTTGHPACVWSAVTACRAASVLRKRRCHHQAHTRQCEKKLSSPHGSVLSKASYFMLASRPGRFDLAQPLATRLSGSNKLTPGQLIPVNKECCQFANLKT